MLSCTVVVFLLTATVLTLVYCDFYRLPNNVKPIRYYLTMEPHLRDTNIWDPIPYEGSVMMELEALENTKTVTFHQVDLEIDKSTIRIVSSNRKDMKLSATSNDEDTQTYTIQLENKLIQREYYNLTIGKFTGNLGDGTGFFKAFYWKNTTARNLAGTHFYKTGARRAFPCFDEPNLKSRFIVSLIRKEEYNSVSNENLLTTEDLGDGRFKDTFKETPIMSTYTLAFAVSDYKSSEKLERHRILGRPDAIFNDEWKFPLEIAKKTLIALEKYTGIDYTLDKMDQIAIPNDYFYGRAPDWGLIVYGESHLMRDNESRAEDFQRTTCFIAYTFAHQWFGNLVTPAWWDYQWLSEEFARYLQYHIADVVQPSWRLKDQFLIDVVQEVLRKEESDSAHALNYKIQYSGQYSPFHIELDKGGSILRMMEHFLTHDVFRRGIQIFLQENKFGNVLPSHLYVALQEAVNKAGVNNFLNNMSVAEIMETWDSRRGFPTITVSRDYKTGNVTLDQRARFDKNNNKNVANWIVPINYVFSAGGKLDFRKTTADYWLTEQNATINHDFPTDGWLIVNKQETGYYRVNYDLENWERLIKVLNSENFKSIDVLNRAQLIDDAFNLAFNEQLPWDIPLRLGEYVVRERDYIALNPFYNALNSYLQFCSGYGNDDCPSKAFRYFSNVTLINDISVENRTEYEVFKEYVRTTLRGVKNSLGFEAKPDDTHLDQLHRSKFINFYQYFLI